jgi:hypothetical protein
MQPNQTRLTPVYSSGPMQPRQDVQSFDLTRNSGPTRSLVTGDRRLSGPTRSLVTGDRSLTRNPNGRMGMPQMPGGGQSYGKTPAAGYSGQRLNSFGQPFQGNKIRGVGYRDPGQRGYDQPQAAPQGYGQPAPGMPANNTQPLPAPLDPLANLPPPATTEQALGMSSYGSPAPAEANTEQPLLPPLNMPWTGQPLPGGVPMGQLPPSTMNGATGVPPPPAYSMQQVGGFNVLTGPDGKGGSKFLNAYTDPNRGAPTPLSASEMGRIRAAGYAPAEIGGRSFDAQGVPYLQPLPQPTEKITEGPTGTTRTYTQPRGTQASPPAGEGGSNYFDSLLPAAPTASTQTGQMPVTPTASTQTGQMPNVAYAAPMRSEPPQASTQNGQMPNVAYAAPIRSEPPQASTQNDSAEDYERYYATYSPEMNLESARQEYARTGDDSWLREHYRRFPSEAVRLGRQEQQIWQQIAEEVNNFGRAANEKANNYEVRNDTLNMGFMGGNPFTTGTKALEYDAAFPGRTQIMNAPLPMLNRGLFAKANALSRDAAASSAQTMERIRNMAK